MSRRVVVATFTREEDLLHAARAVRSRRLTVLDAYTPYAVHGLDEALGLPPSRLPWVCAVLGSAGAGFMLWFQQWASAVDWPINVGGKPWNSLPAFVPVIFESMVLAGGVGTVLAFFLVSRLLPGRKARLAAPGITDDCFALVIEETDAAFDLDQVRGLLGHHGADAVEERVLFDDSTRTATAKADQAAAKKRRAVLNAVLAGLLLVVVLATILATGGAAQRNWEFFPNMVWSAADDAYQVRTAIPQSQSPAPGSLAREQTPLRYEPTEAGAKVAGEELKNPFRPGDAAALERGAEVFRNFCAACHGAGGLGDGPVAARGYPPPPSLVTGNTRTMPDGELFHIITFGRRNMPSHAPLVEPDDRWKAILHIRSLQGREDKENRP